MKGVPAIYLGRIVDKKYFRAVVYGTNGEKKLVESWDEFESCMESGLWFASLDDLKSNKNDEPPKDKRKYKVKEKVKKTIEEIKEEPDQEEHIDGLSNDMVFEVTNANK